MTGAFASIATYVVLVGVASFIEGPVSRGFGAFQLNVLIRAGSMGAALIALGFARSSPAPTGSAILAGLAIGALTGVGSLFYCFALDYLSVSLVVVLSNLYIVITLFLGVVVLAEPVTVWKVAGLLGTLAGILLLARAPARSGVHREVDSGRRAIPPRALVFMGAYIAIIGVASFLEKPALRGLDATQLNAVMSVAMTAVGIVALTLRGTPLAMTRRLVPGLGVGAMMGVASVFYFLGLRGLPLSVAAASANSYVVITVLLSTILLHRPLSRSRAGAIVLTLGGVTVLALSAT